jgi:WD40 repeat protein
MVRIRGLLVVGIGVALLAGFPTDRLLRGKENRVPPSEVKQGPVDRFGDPLPEGAVARLGTVRLRHSAAVARLAFIGDGRNLASLGEDNYFHLWNAASGKEISRFALSRIPIQETDGTAIEQRMMRGMFMRWRRRRFMKDSELPFQPPLMAFAANGKYLAERCQGNTFRVYDLTTGKALGPVERGPRAVEALAFSPTGKVLAIGGGNSEGDTEASQPAVLLWDVAKGKKLRELKWPQLNSSLSLLVFSPDGSLLAGVSGTEVRLWDVAGGKKLRKYEGHEGPISGLAFTPDGKQLATASIDQTIRLWELDSEEEICTLRTKIPLLTVALSPQGKRLAAGGTDGRLRLWDLKTHKPVRDWSGHKSPVRCVAFSPDGKALASGGTDGLIRLWDPATGKERSPERYPEKLKAVFLAGDGRTVVLGHPDGARSEWDTARGKALRRYKGPEGTFLAVVFAPGGKTAALSDRQGVIHLWDVARGEELRKLEGHQEVVPLLAFAPDGRTLASAGIDQSLRLWDVATGKELRQLVRPVGDDNVPPAVRRWRWRRQQQVGGPGGLAFSHDGKTLGFAAGDKIRLWETASGDERAAFRATVSEGSLFAFSPDGAVLALCHGEDSVQLLSADTGKVRHLLLGHEGKIHALAFAANGKQLATAGKDRTVRLWDVATGKEVRRFTGHQGTALAVAFAPDGKRLVSTSTDGTALVWDLTSRPLAKPPLTPSHITRLLARGWTDLASSDGKVAYRSIGRLAGFPKEVVPFLRPRLKPVVVVNSERLTRLITELDDQRYAVRRRATKELERLDRQALPVIRKALQGKLSKEAHRLLTHLVNKLNGAPSTPAALQASRALEILERVGTGEARRLLTDLAAGAPQARLTREAKQCLRRLSLRGAAKH